MVDYNLDKRKYVIGGVAIAIVVIYAIRLFTLQIMSEDYKKNADSNAFLKQIEFPSRGAIYDRNGKLMVYNSPSYDIMVVMKEQEDVWIRWTSATPGHYQGGFREANGGHQGQKQESRILAIYPAALHESAF